MTTALLVPSKLKAWPTLPVINVVPLNSVPLLLSTVSLALPSPGHQLTKPEGAATQLVPGVRWARLCTSVGESALEYITTSSIKPINGNPPTYGVFPIARAGCSDAARVAGLTVVIRLVTKTPSI